MAMEKALGTALQTGVDATGISGVHEQTSGKNAAGEIKYYYDAEGDMLSIYTWDKHDEYSFEALLETSVEDKEIGDSITINEETCVVTQWYVSARNDDVKRVTIGARTCPDLASSGTQTQGSQTPAGGSGN